MVLIILMTMCIYRAIAVLTLEKRERICMQALRERLLQSGCFNEKLFEVDTFVVTVFAGINY